MTSVIKSADRRTISVVMTGPSRLGKGGIAAFARVLCDHIEHRRHDVSLRYLSTAPPSSDGLVTRAAVALGAYVRFAQAARGTAVIAHVNTASNSDFWRNVPFLLMARLCNTPTVLHIHPPWSFRNYVRRGWFPVVWLKLMGVRLADVVVAPSPSAIVPVSDLVRPEIVRVVPNGVDGAGYRSLPLVERGHRVTFLGWLVPQKGINELLRAMSILRARGVAADLFAYGPYGAESVRGLAEKLGIGDRVVTGEWIDGTEKCDLLCRSRVLALPSYTEGFPVVLLEALQAGVPIVATNVGGIPDVVREGVTGFLVECKAVDALADRLEALLTDDGLWETMHSACLAQAPAFRVDRVTDLLVEVYGELGSRA